MKPLVVVTRDEGPAGALRRSLEGLGAEVWALPCTSTAPPRDPTPLAAAVAALSSFDWLVVTSGRAVRALVEHSAWPAAWPGRTRAAAVGPATAARLREEGVAVDRVGAGGGEDLARALVGSGAVGPGTRVLWPRAEAGRPEPGRTLARAGAELVDPVAYRTLAAHPALAADLEGFRAALERGRLAAVTFASPSAAEGLAEHLPTRDLRPLHGHTLVASIGATTSASLAERGAPADVEAERPRAEALARAVMERLRVPQGAHT